MELEQAKKRVEELRAVIEKNNRLYYDQDAPELEDFEYDALTRDRAPRLDSLAIVYHKTSGCVNIKSGAALSDVMENTAPSYVQKNQIEIVLHTSTRTGSMLLVISRASSTG